MRATHDLKSMVSPCDK